MNEQTTIVITLTFLRGFCGVVAILPMSCWRLAGMGLVSLIVINVPNEMEGPDVCESQVCIEYNLWLQVRLEVPRLWPRGGSMRSNIISCRRPASPALTHARDLYNGL